MNKRRYEHPEAIVLELRTQGMLCQSPDTVSASRDGYGAASEQTWN